MALVIFLENPLRNFRQASTHSAPQSLTPPLIRRSQALPPSPQQAELFLLSGDGSAPMESELLPSRRRNPRLLPSPPRPPGTIPSSPPAPSPTPTRSTAAAAAQISPTRDATPRGNTPSWLACSLARACIGIPMRGAPSSSPQRVVHSTTPSLRGVAPAPSPRSSQPPLILGSSAAARNLLPCARASHPRRVRHRRIALRFSRSEGEDHGSVSVRAA
jgi:hypothetical protein